MQQVRKMVSRSGGTASKMRRGAGGEENETRQGKTRN